MRPVRVAGFVEPRDATDRPAERYKFRTDGICVPCEGFLSQRGDAMTLLNWLRNLLAPGPRDGRTDTKMRSNPARLIVMRHAEKTGDKNDMHLSAAGQKRAERLATYIPQTFGRPDFLVAAMKSKRSNRSYETLLPLSRATGIAIDESYKDTDARELADALRSDARYTGKFGVIAWHHSTLPELLDALGAPAGTYPADWGSDVFNLIVEIDYRAGGPPAVRQIIEQF